MLEHISATISKIMSKLVTDEMLNTSKVQGTRQTDLDQEIPLQPVPGAVVVDRGDPEADCSFPILP